SSGFTEQAAFRHYLHCLRGQCAGASLGTYDETVQAHNTLLTSAAALLATLHAAGIKGQLRDFREIVDVNRAALAVLDTTRASILRRRWPTIA
ncbi:MAG: hypothetical protein Q7S58_18945, partial [Candidatus Binatus sp.]